MTTSLVHLKRLEASEALLSGYPRILEVFQRGGEIVGTRGGVDRVPKIDPHHEGQPESGSYRMASDHVSRGTMRAARGNVVLCR